MAKGVVMTRWIQRGGSVWRDFKGWSVTFDSRDFFDPIRIVNKENTSEAISLSLEDADQLVDFIKEAKKAYAKHLRYEVHPFYPFGEETEESES